MLNRRPVLALFTSLFVLAACSSDGGTTTAPTTPSAASSDTAPLTEAPTAVEPTTPAPPATEVAVTEPVTIPAPAAVPLEIEAAGPYTVGVQTIVIDDGTRNRPLSVDVWFPLKSGTTGTPYEYTLLPGTFYRSPAAITATPADIATDGPFPLVVYSHGSGGLRYIASYYTEFLASHGYVVAAPDHTGNTAVDRLSGAEADFLQTALNRPTDVDAVIDAMTDPTNAITGGFAAVADPEKIAVTGHSFGGFTALAMASGFSNAAGTFVADPRVDAIIPLAPASGDGGATTLLTDADLKAIAIPTLLIVGTDDKTTPVVPNVSRPWDLASTEILYRAELKAAEHQSFTDICDYQEFLPTLPNVLPLITDTINSFAQEACAPGDMPIDRAKELTNTLAVDFLDQVFKSGEPIDPDTLEIPADLSLQSKN